MLFSLAVPSFLECISSVLLGRRSDVYEDVSIVARDWRLDSKETVSTEDSLDIERVNKKSYFLEKQKKKRLTQRMCIMESASDHNANKQAN